MNTIVEQTFCDVIIINRLDPWLLQSNRQRHKHRLQVWLRRAVPLLLLFPQPRKIYFIYWQPISGREDRLNEGEEERGRTPFALICIKVCDYGEDFQPVLHRHYFWARCRQGCHQSRRFSLQRRDTRLKRSKGCRRCRRRCRCCCRRCRGDRFEAGDPLGQIVNVRFIRVQRRGQLRDSTIV